jgi:hypothetical protein
MYTLFSLAFLLDLAGKAAGLSSIMVSAACQQGSAAD